MFEKGKIVSRDADTGESEYSETVGSSDVAGRSGDALRAIEWSELTARLAAARDLRRELHEDAVLCAGSTGASFGDAAARWFGGLEAGERSVNLDALDEGKASRGKSCPTDGDAAKGDVRDDND